MSNLFNVLAELPQSPTPWGVYEACGEYSIYDANEQTVIEDECLCKKDADLIVRCVNAHDKLVEALKKVIDGDRGCCNVDGSHDCKWVCRDCEFFVQNVARVALAAAEGCEK